MTGHYPQPHRGEGEGYVSKRAARDRHEKERAEAQVRSLSAENARLRRILKENGLGA
jgi:hypothetical protein